MVGEKANATLAGVILKLQRFNNNNVSIIHAYSPPLATTFLSFPQILKVISLCSYKEAIIIALSREGSLLATSLN